MPDINSLAQNLSLELFQRLNEAVETGKWQDGIALSTQQKAETLQLVLAYQALYNENPDHFTIAKGGELHMQKKSDLKKQFYTEKDPSEIDLHKIQLPVE